MKLEKLFVYGSMKKNFLNHDRILKGNSIFISTATTVEHYMMFPDSQYLFPYLLELSNSESLQIKGELYNVPISYIEEVIDIMEGCPDFYYRKKIKIFDDNLETHEAYIYFLNPLNKEISYDDGFQLNEWEIKHQENGLKLNSFYEL